jgi:hypothetical protein
MLRKPFKTDGKTAIYGNTHAKTLILWDELDDKQRGEMSNYDKEDSFFIYKGNVYSLNDFMRIDKYMPELFQKFDGYMNDSFFSGILIKFCDDFDKIKVYTFIS